MNRSKSEQTIFAEALRLPSHERAAYLAQSTVGDPELREEVESLLRSYAAGEFLEQAAAPEVRPTAQATAPLTERPGDTIGRYKLLQQIGEGGCGVVYMAEQDEPFHRRVALKIIKLGMDTKSVIARFEAERQALAMMDHPNIARVLDAGATQTGRPYFVMELVRGMKITDFCDEKRLSTKQRLDLFIQVCHAIQHAHQKGIIHRDIKPSNILVTINDGVPVPKVIDFGIAKATGGLRLTERTLFTAFEQFIGTPAYMSPEQAVLTSLDIDTRSDIYALGVLLYELLTGKTPFDAKELLAIGLDEMRRTIREQEPARPSTRLSTLPGQELSTTAQRRGLDAPKLVSELRGDLDWIVMKALEKDRARRYETANGLAADIQRHLNNEPVVARPPSKLYEFQKTLRRHKVGFAATAAVIVALSFGLAVAGWMFLQERAALQRAMTAEQRAEQERDRALEAEQQALRERDRAVEAEASQRQILGLFVSRPMADSDVIPLLEEGVRVSEARLGPTNEATIALMIPLAWQYGAAARWTDALQLYGILTEVTDDHMRWWEAHAAALAAGRTNLGRELCASMLSRFGDSRDPWVSQRVAQSLLLSPCRPSDLEIASRLADKAFKWDPGYRGVQTTKGMAEFRLGHYQEADRLLEPARHNADPNLGCLAAYFLAMTRHQQGQTESARDILKATNQRFANLLHAGHLGRMWHDSCRNLVGRSEAERLIFGREISPTVTADFLVAAYRKHGAVSALLKQGFSFAKQGKWKESAAAYAEALRHPDFHWQPHSDESQLKCLQLQMGTAFVRAGDHVGHDQLCRYLLTAQPGSPSEREAERFARMCFTRGKSLPVDLQQKALELARLAVGGRTLEEVHDWTCQMGGIAEYYAGDLERAVELLTVAARNFDIVCKGPAMAYRAMALKELGRHVEAVAVLQSAETVLAQFLQSRPGEHGYPWWDLEFCELALEQARYSIGGSPEKK